MTSKRALFILMINQREVEDGWKMVDLKTNEKVSIDVRFEGETVWLTQAQLVDLYGSSKANVSEHIKHIF